MELKAKLAHDIKAAKYRAKFVTLRFLAIELPAAVKAVTQHEKPKVHSHQIRRDPVQVLGDEGERSPEMQRPPDG